MAQTAGKLPIDFVVRQVPALSTVAVMTRHDKQIRYLFGGYAGPTSMNQLRLKADAGASGLRTRRMDHRPEGKVFGGLPCVPSAGLWAPLIAECPHVISGTKAWFGGAAMARQCRTFARMSRRTCSTPTWFRLLERSHASFPLADRPPHVRHRLPRIAAVAQAHDRRPLEGRTRLLSQRCASVRRLPMGQVASAGYVHACACAYDIVIAIYFVVHTDRQPDPSTPSQSFRKWAGSDVQRSRVVACRRQLESADFGTSQRPSCTRCRRRTCRVAGRRSSRCDLARLLGFQAASWRRASHTCPKRQVGAFMPRTMAGRRSATAACGSGMDSTSMGIFFCGAGLLAVTVQAALEASATTDG